MRRRLWLAGWWALACNAGEAPASAAKAEAEPASAAAAPAKTDDEAKTGDEPAGDAEDGESPGDAEEPARPEPAMNDGVVDSPGFGPEGPALAWTVPSCPLTYRYRSRSGSKGGTSHIFAGFELTMRAHPDDATKIVVAHGKMKAHQTLDGKRWGAPIEIAAGELAPVHLATDGTTLREVDGTTKLWSAFTSIPLQLFWVPLPASPREGAVRAWAIPDNSTNPDVDRTEAARGTLELPADYEPADYEPKPPIVMPLRLTGWETVRGQRVTVVEVDERKSGPGSDPPVEIRMKAKARILPSGRLLDARATLWLTRLDAPEVVAEIHGEIGLVKACDGPTVKLAPFDPEHDGGPLEPRRAGPRSAAMGR